MPPPHKGKVPTKGAKQILVENTATINFYRNMSAAASLAYVVLTTFFFYDTLFSWTIYLNVLVMLISTACYQIMRYISRPIFGDNNQLIDPGLDLNMEGGMGEHIKDITILTSIVQVLSVGSNYFWFLLLLLPARAFWLLWVNLLQPWFFQEAPEDTEQDNKKKKKMERKMKRYQQ